MNTIVNQNTSDSKNNQSSEEAMNHPENTLGAGFEQENPQKTYHVEILNLDILENHMTLKSTTLEEVLASINVNLIGKLKSDKNLYIDESTISFSEGILKFNLLNSSSGKLFAMTSIDTNTWIAELY